MKLIKCECIACRVDFKFDVRFGSPHRLDDLINKLIDDIFCFLKVMERIWEILL